MPQVVFSGRTGPAHNRQRKRRLIPIIAARRRHRTAQIAPNKVETKTEFDTNSRKLKIKTLTGPVPDLKRWKYKPGTNKNYEQQQSNSFWIGSATITRTDFRV